MKNQKGITLISLVITIILIIILASVAVYTGFDTYENMKVKAFVAKMKTMQEAVDKLCDKYTIQEINTLGTGLPADAITVFNTVKLDDSKKSWYSEAGDDNEINYRYFSIDDVSSVLGLKDFDTPIFLNPRTRNVIALKGIKYEDKMYYRQYDLPNGQTLVTPNTDTNFTLETSFKTFDNKAVIYVDTDKDIAELKYYKQKEDGSFGNAIISKNLKEITITESGTYKVEAKVLSSSTENISEESLSVKDGEIIKTSPNLEITIVNKPMLVSGMTPVKYDDSGSQEDTMASDKDWYNYSSDKKMWANARLSDGSVYVWIPRYAYHIDETNKVIDIEFMKENSSLLTTSGDSLSNNYEVMPAFQNGTNSDFANGEWDSELMGIWIAKYEASVDGDYAKAIPGVTATCNRSITDIKTYCNNIKTKVSDMNLSNVDTHLMKNSDWGAATYLTCSKYGNTTISHKQGFSTQIISEANTSTGNYYGIDGLIGGTQEIVAAGIDISSLNSTNVSNKYATLYNSDKTKNNIDGDGIKNISWLEDGNYQYPDSNNKFFARGGYNNNGSHNYQYNNIFAYLNVPETNDNDKYNYTGFRPVLIVEY